MPENGWTEHEFNKIEKFASENKAHVLTIMYDDIVGSSTMTEQIGGVVFKELKESYNKTFMKIVTRNGRGDVIKPRGDGFMSVFTEPSSAVECALELQQVFNEHGKFRIRIGLDMGQVYKQGEGVLKDLIGSHANWAARAESMSDVGHILVTRSVYNDASAWIHKSLVSWKRHGLYRLKDGEEALELFEPYNANLIKPLDKPRGTKATYCIRCGFCADEKDTFRCKICGDSGICGKCYDSHYQQCIKCRTETPSCVTSEKRKSDFQLKIWLEKEGKSSRDRNVSMDPKTGIYQYQLGDKIALHIESSEDAYVYIFNINSLGDITPLFPNRIYRNNYVKAGRIFRFPDETAGFDWELQEDETAESDSQLQEPVEAETIKVFATKTPADMEWMKTTLFEQSDIRDIRVILKSFERIPPDQWTEASCSFVVFKP